MITLSLAGYNLNDVGAGISVQSTDIWSSATRQITSHQLALQSGSVDTFSKFKSRTINIKGWINRATKLEFERTLDHIKRLSYDNSVELSVGYEDGARRWQVSVEKIIFDRLYLPDHCDFEIQVWAADPFGYGDRVTITDSILSGSQQNAPGLKRTFFANNFQGTSTAPIRPVINFNITQWEQTQAATLVRTYLWVGNDTTGEFVKINFSPNRTKYVPLVLREPFIVDFQNRKVVKGAGVDVDIDGTWPEWSPAERNWQIAFISNPEARWTINYGGHFTHRYS